MEQEICQSCGMPVSEERKKKILKEKYNLK
jgi:hypothetical protein